MVAYPSPCFSCSSHILLLDVLPHREAYRRAQGDAEGIVESNGGFLLPVSITAPEGSQAALRISKNVVYGCIL